MPSEVPVVGGAHRREPGGSRWLLVVVLLVGALAVGGGIYATRSAGQVEEQVESVTSERDAAADQGEDLARRVLAACERGEVVQSSDGRDLCQRASVVQATPVPAVPPEVIEGAPGRGIRGTTLDPAGHLIVSYTDGSSQDVGLVVGADGDRGPGIASAQIVDGSLVLTYSDGVTQNLGPVVGPNGTDGRDGDPGRGIASVDQQDGRLVVIYDDGTTEDAGPLPRGPAGPSCPDGTTLRAVVYADGARGVGCVLDQQPTTVPPEPTITPTQEPSTEDG